MTEQVYNSTSLTLRNLTCGENYSISVYVTNGTGQHAAWSEKLNVAWNGEYDNNYYIICISLSLFFFTLVPQFVVNFSVKLDADSACHASTYVWGY